MKKALIVFLAISFTLILGGCKLIPTAPNVNNTGGINENANNNQNTNQDDQLIGGDKDEHGCLIAAGYTWCEAKQKCYRSWEEICQSKEPKQVVESYVNNTLIVTPNNYAKAIESLMPDLQKQFDETPGFVPQSYGIQDGPVSVTAEEAKINGTDATVNVVGHYDGTDVIWVFNLKIHQGEWKINSYLKDVNGNEDITIRKAYENKKINLIFSYPDDFEITTDDAGHIWPNGFQSHKIVLTRKDNSEIKLQIEANVDGYGPFFPDTMYNIEDTEAGKISILSKTPGDSPNADDGVGFIVTTALTAKNGQAYQWKLWYVEGDIELPKIFDEILASTRLTK